MTDEELFKLIEAYLGDQLYNLWNSLEHEQRRRVFPHLLMEYITSNF